MTRISPNIAALQWRGTNADAQIALYSRYASTHFVPDIIGDLEFNDVASNVTRASVLDGIQGDASYIVNERHTLRFGFRGKRGTDQRPHGLHGPARLGRRGDRSAISNPRQQLAARLEHRRFRSGRMETDQSAHIECRLRFDQLYQYVDANQLSPRLALVYKPFEGTTLHVGYARYFTPPYQAQTYSANIALFTNTTNQPDVELR